MPAVLTDVEGAVAGAVARRWRRWSGERRGFRRKVGPRGRRDGLRVRDARRQRETALAFDGSNERNSRLNFFSTDHRGMIASEALGCVDPV